VTTVTASFDWPDLEITTRGDHVEVVGAPAAELRQAITLLRTVKRYKLTPSMRVYLDVINGTVRESENDDSWKAVQEAAAQEVRAHARSNLAGADLRDALGERLPPEERSAVRERAVQRAIEHRRALVETPTYTYADLGAIRDVAASTIRSFVHRHRPKIVAVTVGSSVMMPAFQFNEAGSLRESVAEINEILHEDEGTMDEWSRWAWWHSRTSYLSGESPINVIDDDLERVRTAAMRMTTRNRA